jgi:hypothetical protein
MSHAAHRKPSLLPVKVKRIGSTINDAAVTAVCVLAFIVFCLVAGPAVFGY